MPATGTKSACPYLSTPKVLIRAWTSGDTMKSADVERIFEPFVRLDEARASDVGGAGLGLSIVHSIVLAHDGSLSVATAPGIGSTFTIRFPLG